MGLIQTMVLELPAVDLLKAIWYSDGSGGSGANIGVESTDLPDDYRLVSAYHDEKTGMVRLSLIRKSLPVASPP